VFLNPVCIWFHLDSPGVTVRCKRERQRETEREREREREMPK